MRDFLENKYSLFLWFFFTKLQNLLYISVPTALLLTAVILTYCICAHVFMRAYMLSILAYHVKKLFIYL